MSLQPRIHRATSLYPTYSSLSINSIHIRSRSISRNRLHHWSNKVLGENKHKELFHMKFVLRHRKSVEGLLPILNRAEVSFNGLAAICCADRQFGDVSCVFGNRSLLNKVTGEMSCS